MRRVVAAAAAVGVLTACGGSKPGGGGGSTGNRSASGGSPATVVVKNFSFMPGNLSVAKGTTVTWKFEDDAAHNVTAKDSSFMSKDLQSGSYSHRFTTPGRYSYLCTIHQYMTGTITVR
jgi:plastocyanin